MNADKLWEALKQECACDPKNAVRLVMVSKKHVERAVARMEEKK